MPKLMARDFTPTFTVEMWIKDLELILAEAKRYNIVLPSINQIRLFYESLKANGGKELGFHALLKTLEELNGIKPKN